MKEIKILNQKYAAEKIIKKDNSIKLVNAYYVNNEEETIFAGNIEFPNISNINDFQLEEGQEFDTDEKQGLAERVLALEQELAETKQILKQAKITK